jgi:hypothetical protein
MAGKTGGVANVVSGIVQKIRGRETDGENQTGAHEGHEQRRQQNPAYRPRTPDIARSGIVLNARGGLPHNFLPFFA